MSKNILHTGKFDNEISFKKRRTSALGTDMPRKLAQFRRDPRQTFVNCASCLLQDWSNINVTCVPGVMLQVRFWEDADAEYRIHWILGNSETYIHNHRYKFITYCVDGGYTESSWTVDSTQNTNTFAFVRGKGNVISQPIQVTGALKVVEVRHHYPGRLMSVGNCRFHTIIGSSDTVTFVKIIRRNPTVTHILSPDTIISAPTEEVRPATAAERCLLHKRLRGLLRQYGT